MYVNTIAKRLLCYTAIATNDVKKLACEHTLSTWRREVVKKTKKIKVEPTLTLCFPGNSLPPLTLETID